MPGIDYFVLAKRWAKMVQYSIELLPVVDFMIDRKLQSHKE